jgi:hypothetical protein
MESMSVLQGNATIAWCSVIHAKAEGGALCALLNQWRIVDGISSNDGDCLGPLHKILEQSRVM